MEMKTTAVGGSEFCLVLTPTWSAAIRAREAILRGLGILSEQTRRDLATVVFELVQNSVDHGPRRPIIVTVVVGGNSIRGEVSGHAPVVGPAQINDREKSDASGLALVDRLTSRWAVQGSTDVWFEIPLGG
jgi:anti-sigma regulatory factor (Ser/Thr protein kinase)